MIRANIARRRNNLDAFMPKRPMYIGVACNIVPFSTNVHLAALDMGWQKIQDHGLLTSRCDKRHSANLCPRADVADYNRRIFHFCQDPADATSPPTPDSRKNARNGAPRPDPRPPAPTRRRFKLDLLTSVFSSSRFFLETACQYRTSNRSRRSICPASILWIFARIASIHFIFWFHHGFGREEIRFLTSVCDWSAGVIKPRVC